MFSGSIQLAAGAPGADGELQVADGDVITVTYIDADDGSGGTNVPRTDTALVDGQAPSFAGLSSADAGDGCVILSWAAGSDASLPIHYSIYRSQAPGGEDFGSALASTESTSYRDEAVSNGQSYYYVVRAQDAVGNQEGNRVERSATPRAPSLIYSYPLDSDPGWSCEGQWQFGQPTGEGSHCLDPTSGRTGSYVYGYDLYGDYPDNMDAKYLTTTSINCSNLHSVSLRFWRWLGVESSSYDHAAVEVTSDGVNWTTAWEHSTGSLCDGSWVQCSYDISAVADSQPTVYIRWRMGPTDGSVTYPGWNIDDVEIWGVAGDDYVFPDVTEGFWAYDEIYACVAAGIVRGYTDGRYHPELPVTRDQMAVFVARAVADGDVNVPDPGCSAAPFVDVPCDQWARKYIQFCVGNGIVEGYDDGLYRPVAQVTRDQMAVYVARSVVDPGCRDDLSCYSPPDIPTFPDVLADFWALRHIEYCAEAGIVRGYDDGRYHPEIVVTRDQMAVYISKAFLE
jgi:hypothetical protein